MKDRLAEILRVLRLEGQAILDCTERLQSGESATQLNRALDLLTSSLAQGGKIIVTGVGKSGKVGQKIAATLSSTGSYAVFLHPTEGLHGDLGIVQPRDVVLALSQTGNTEELLRLLPSLQKAKIPVIAITGNSQSQLAARGDAWIDSSVTQEACPHNLAPTTSTTLALALGDALAVTLMQIRGFDANSFALNHPGGAIGKRLTLTVADVMHQGVAVPTVQSDATMEEVVVKSTEKKLGGVLVVQKETLLGIITDGDIRRALRHKERFFELQAQEVMTARPVTVTPERMANEALELMENRPSQISVLPVVNALGHWLGIVRLHDLIKTL